MASDLSYSPPGFSANQAPVIARMKPKGGISVALGETGRKRTNAFTMTAQEANTDNELATASPMNAATDLFALAAFQL